MRIQSGRSREERRFVMKRKTNPNRLLTRRELTCAKGGTYNVRDFFTLALTVRPPPAAPVPTRPTTDLVSSAFGQVKAVSF